MTSPTVPTSTNTGSRLLAAVASNWLLMALGVVYTLLITPTLVRSLGTELYGAWSFLNGVLVYTDLLYLGLGMALVKYVAEYRASHDQAAINRLSSVVLTVYSILGLLCLALSSAFAPFAARVIFGASPPPGAEVLPWVCVAQGVRMLFLFVATAYGGVIFGLDRLAYANGFKALLTVARIVALPAILSSETPFLALAIFTAGMAALEAFGLAAMAFRLNRELVTRLTRPTLPELRLLYGFGVPSFMILLSARLVNYTDTTVIGLTLGAASVAVYSLPLQLIEYVRFASSALVTAMLPQLTVLSATGNQEALRSQHISATKLTCFLTTFAVFGVVTRGPEFLRLWIGPELASPSQPILAVLGAATILQAFGTQASFPFLQAMSRLVVPATLLSVEAVLNLVLSVSWVRPHGLVGVAMATLIPTVTVSFLFIPAYLSRQLDASLALLLRATFIPVFVLLVAMVMVEWYAVSQVPTFSYTMLLAKSSLLTVIAALIGYITLPSERDRIFGVVGGVLRLQRTATARPPSASPRTL